MMGFSRRCWQGMGTFKQSLPDCMSLWQSIVSEPSFPWRERAFLLVKLDSSCRRSRLSESFTFLIFLATLYSLKKTILSASYRSDLIWKIGSNLALPRSARREKKNWFDAFSSVTVLRGSSVQRPILPTLPNLMIQVLLKNLRRPKLRQILQLMLWIYSPKSMKMIKLVGL